MVIANGRSIGDADGFCTYYSDNMLGRSSVDLCVVSTSLYPNIGQLVVLPKWECSDHLPVKFGWFASGCIGTQHNGNPERVTNNNKRNNNKIRYNEDQNENYKQAVRKGSVVVELTNCISELTEGQYGVGEALIKMSSIIKRCMERAFGNKQAKPTGARWWMSVRPRK